MQSGADDAQMQRKSGAGRKSRRRFVLGSEHHTVYHGIVSTRVRYLLGSPMDFARGQALRSAIMIQTTVSEE